MARKGELKRALARGTARRVEEASSERPCPRCIAPREQQKGLGAMRWEHAGGRLPIVGGHLISTDAADGRGAKTRRSLVGPDATRCGECTRQPSSQPRR